MAYFDALRKSGKSDDTFEDEYFFTLPAVSGSNLDYYFYVSFTNMEDNIVYGKLQVTWGNTAKSHTL